ncbi:hypothetical protein ANCCAN_15857 [Ancylostoma caninum]|uniref:Uncharacterized protein n=1 Tax=Ancylostoma caninum TaxID=29170 RepID=A0A368G182_ANCCA|nr:hypothetical protein ANCCAN_15857 [Ancylostoma caninum]
MSGDESSHSDLEASNGVGEEKTVETPVTEDGAVKRERPDDPEKSPSPPSKKARTESDEQESEKKRSKDEQKESPSKNSDSRSRSPESKRRRSEKDKGKSKKKEDKNDNRKEKSRKEKDSGKESAPKDDGVEEGEVVEPAREPTARELERMRLIEQLAKEDAEIDGPSSSARGSEPAHNSRACPYLDTIDRCVVYVFCSKAVSLLEFTETYIRMLYW